jgi:hypothetical protein
VSALRFAPAARVALAAFLAIGLVVGGSGPDGHGPSIVRAATPGLTLVTDAAYVVQPDRGRVAVRVAITATNHRHDTLTKRYYYRTAILAVLPLTSGFKLTADAGSPRVSVVERHPSYTLLKLDLGSRLRSGASRSLVLTFNLVDPGGAPDRPVRISPTLVSFYAWAFATADTPGSSVSVTFPASYTVTIGRGPLTGPTVGADGSQTWTSGPLDLPLAFVADLTADRPSDYVEADRSVQVGAVEAQLVLRSWPDDPGWRDRVGDLMAEALPALSQAIGVGWRLGEPLLVQEALPRSTGGYAGLFDPSQHRIEVAYAAPAGVVFHEAAHAWFNGALLADRWAAEAFASYYAAAVGAALDVPVSSPELTPELEATAVPLNAWGPVGSAPADVEAYGYAASLALARAIARRAGDDALRQVWALAADGYGAYQPPGGEPEPLGTAFDWRSLLDLLEATTGRSFVDLWRTWVLRPEDVPAITARAAARTAYDQGVADAADWQLPPSIREAMRTWRYDDAQRQLAVAEGVLRQRAALQRAAAAASLQLPATLRHEFETGDVVAAASEATAELSTVGVIEAAREARPEAVPLLDAIGLLGTDPDGDLQSAAAAFAAGDLDAANRAAATATTAWASATDVGRGRIISAIGLALALVLLAGLLVGYRRRGAHRRSDASDRGSGGSSTPADGLHSRP